MTRKQALLEAINECNNPEVKEKLLEIYEHIPIMHWDKESIVDALENYHFETGNNPTTTIIDTNAKLPSHQVIENIFGIKANEFLSIYFPPEKSKEQLKEEHNNKVLQDFITEYNRIKPSSLQDYNRRRNKKCKCSTIVCKAANCSRWRELIEKLKLPKYRDGNPLPEINIVSSITITYNGQKI